MQNLLYIPGSTYKKEELKLISYIEDIAELLSDQGAIIAGGAVTSMFNGQEVNDIDVYFPSKESFTKVVRELYRDYIPNSKDEISTQDYDVDAFTALFNIVTSKAILCDVKGTKVQLVAHKFYDSVEAIFENFDFTVCMSAYDLKNSRWVFHPEFLKHNSQRYLHFNPGTAYPLCSALRVKKYEDKGYKIPRSQFYKILFACNQKKIESWEDLKGELGGLYGTPVEEIFNTGEEFNLEKVYTQLDTAYLSEKMKAKPPYSMKSLVEIIPSAFTDEFKVLLGIQAEEQKLDAVEVYPFGLNSRLNW